MRVRTEVDLSQWRRGQIVFGLTRIFGDVDQHDPVAVARDDRFGDRTTRQPLHGLCRDIVKRNGRHGFAGGDAREQGVGSAELGQKPCRHQRLSERPRYKCPARFFHQQCGVEQPEPKPTRCFGHTDRESAKLTQAFP